MDHGTGHAPRVSVIMATYNGSRYIRQSISSILSQTFRDFELIVCDDCSTDDTLAVLRSIDDPRLRIVRNETNAGVVGSRNRCFALARGQFIAMLDHDDLSRPTRLAKQVRYLDAHFGTVLVGTDAHNFENGRLTPTRHPPRSSPAVIRWLLQVANPLVCSSVMFRADAGRRLGTFMREDCKYADDYDLYHRLLRHGEIARLDEPLTIYRLHASNTFKAQEETMIGNAVKVLAQSYHDLFGDQARQMAALVVRHVSAAHGVADSGVLEQVRAVLARLKEVYTSPGMVAGDDVALIERYDRDLWRRVLRASANSAPGLTPEDADLLYGGSSFSFRDRAKMALGRLPMREQLKQVRDRLHRPPEPVPPARVRKFGLRFNPVSKDQGRPPTLFVVVDTEAEFDWDAPFTRDMTGVSAFHAIERGQHVFDRYGLRPIYVVDYPVVTQDHSRDRLRAILARDGCAIGAHPHPWTTPPYTEALTVGNSYPGNLPADLQEQKLVSLLAAIRERFGVAAQFHKAGRYGFGPASPAILARHGIKVDFSIMPGVDLRPKGGPNFRGLAPVPYEVEGTGLLTVPMTRMNLGMAPWLGPASELLRHRPGLGWLKLQPVLAMARMADDITLTPEGVTVDEQIRLVRSMMRDGHRLFVMHYHSPSLSPGHTPYVHTAEEADRFVQSIDDVCRFFFEELGGLPGYPPDLLAMADELRADAENRHELIRAA